ncbi:MATE family efflux transporter [Haladaptatus salinisoli]|uniref:MATE family efflux transporter n=1 Tax=Haladaptatus salinisoli TaxID=2884876 RepID=UPI001D0B1342|nr:MATE family efflux transporter [Haladaptatus salinisoli]
MLGDARRRVQRVLFLFPAALAGLGLLDRKKGEEAFDLAIPVMVTGGMRTLLRVADFFMVSIALDENAVAALEFGFQYFFIPFGLSLALTSGTISVVSRFKGAGEHAKADFAIKQSLWLALLVSVPTTVVTWVYAEPMIAVLTDDPRVVEQGAVYLKIIMLSVSFRFWSMIAARALAGSGDTRTPMYIRLLTLPTNIALNAVLIFGLGPFEPMGVAGAAWGTAVANTLAAVLFTGVLLSGRFSVRLRLGGRQWDTAIAREIVRVGLPLAGTRLSRTLGRFPFLFVLGTLGTGVVASYAIGRRVMLLALMPAWGYSTASSTLVGQSIGAGNDDEANEYGWQTLRIALATQLLLAVVLIAAARPIARGFGTANLDLTVEFVRVFGLGVAAFSVSRTMRGSLRGAGDTKWPLYGTFAGTFLYKLPVAFLAVPPGVVLFSLGNWSFSPGVGLGLLGVYAAILGDMYLRAGVNTFRFWTGEWKRIARESEAGAGARAD